MLAYKKYYLVMNLTAEDAQTNDDPNPTCLILLKPNVIIFISTLCWQLIHLVIPKTNRRIFMHVMHTLYTVSANQEPTAHYTRMCIVRESLFTEGKGL